MRSLSLLRESQLLGAGGYQLILVDTTAFLRNLQRRYLKIFEMPLIKVHETGSQPLLNGRVRGIVIDDNVTECNPLVLTSQAGGLTRGQ